MRLVGAIKTLGEKERVVTTFYFYEYLTLREIAGAMNLTERRISQDTAQGAGEAARGPFGEFEALREKVGRRAAPPSRSPGTPVLTSARLEREGAFGPCASFATSRPRRHTPAGGPRCPGGGQLWNKRSRLRGAGGGSQPPEK